MQFGSPFGVTPSESYWNFTTAGATVGKFQTSNPTAFPLDNHDFLEIPTGRVMLSYPTERTADLRNLNPPVVVATGPGTPPAAYTAAQRYADGLLDEVAPNGTSIWQWRMSDHIPPEESVVPIGWVASPDVPLNAASLNYPAGVTFSEVGGRASSAGGGIANRSLNTSIDNETSSTFFFSVLTQRNTASASSAFVSACRRERAALAE